GHLSCRLSLLARGVMGSYGSRWIGSGIPRTRLLVPGTVVLFAGDCWVSDLTIGGQSLLRGLASFFLPMTSKSRGRPRLQWTPEIDAMIGTMVDADLAELIGVSTTSVRSRRLA